MKKRDRTEIIAAILEITGSGYRATNTKIIYQSFISYTMLQEYLSFMMEKGLIEIEENKQRTLSLVSTEKGRSLLYAYNQLNEMIGRKNTDEEVLDNRDQNSIHPPCLLQSLSLTSICSAVK